MPSFFSLSISYILKLHMVLLFVLQQMCYITCFTLNSDVCTDVLNVWKSNKQLLANICVFTCAGDNVAAKTMVILTEIPP